MIILGFTILFLFLSAFFSASETALFSIPREKVAFYRRDQGTGKWSVYLLLKDAHGTLVTILIGNLLVNVTTVGFINKSLSLYFMNNVLVSLVVATVVILVFGEVIPKNIALRNNENIAAFSAPVLVFIKRVIFPISSLFISINMKLINFFTLYLWKPKESITKEEFISAFKDVFHGKEEDSKAIYPFTYFLSVADNSANSYVIHKSRLEFFKKNHSLKTARDIMFKKRFKFAITFSEKKNKPDGVVFYRDLIYTEDDTIQRYVKPLTSVINTYKISEIFSNMIKDQIEVIAVNDEYGEFVGVLYKDDIAFKIFPSKVVQFTENIKLDDQLNRRMFSGAEELEDIKEWLPQNFRDKIGYIKTLNGVLIDYLGKIPSSGENIAIGRYKFYIKDAEPNLVKKVIIEK